MGRESYWNHFSLSLFLSLLINETNEKKNVQELEKNSKEREGGIFEQRIVLEDSFLSLSLSMKRTKRKMYKNWKRIRKRESEFLKFEERERERGFLGRESYWESSLSFF